MRKIAFVINPNAGKKSKIDLSDFIKDNITSQVEYEILLWEPKEKFDALKAYYLNHAFDIVVACGGDGTVNAVAVSLLHTTIALGILPLGSGNGLARSLGYPMDLKKALTFVCESPIINIDGNQISQYMSFCVSGIGFDAHVSNLFATSTTRGLKTYIKLAMKAYFQYKDQAYLIKVDEEIVPITAFLISFANAPQYGNNAYIAPDASMQDGMIEMVALQKFPLLYAPIAGIRLFNGSIYKSKYIKKWRGRSIQVTPNTATAPIHADGEPYLTDSPIEIKVIPKCLKVVSSL
jgi:diacylglycerol kinase (ATP)